ncbi:CPBP family intramembrane glutamic endopeptidase [Aureitalea marina]|uniref:CAAX protease family protein n=1 Tax=Aureitalea marina TaxID=930804 RepID=A0A2S7KSG1_9FLAO|nr:CPBP family intramembrane glutamic endopeptidase [Aureitalea marina]PQB05569.1 CAAX protease family protein [Aureitalea marina]
MIGLVVILLISWGLLYLFEKKNLNAIGLIPNGKRLQQFAIGLVLIVAICLMLIGIETSLKSIEWQFLGFEIGTIADAFIYHLRSALTEDLVFRGALLFILNQRLGAKWGIMISAICFGVYHVFSYGILTERLMVIGYVIVVTGFTGYVWAWAFHKTRSIYLGLGLHVGYNMIMACFYESQPYGELLFTELSSVDLVDPMASYYSIFRGLFPALMTLISLKFLLRSRMIGSAEIVEQS